jgi:alpha-tubulin suppressor-like RCC1 family protein
MLRPVAVQGGLALTQLSAGDVHTCGNTAAAAHCWGWNRYGQVSDGTTMDRPVPTLVAGPE